jgi:hypothetical protein
MNDEETADMLIHSAEWYAKQATTLIKKYEACRTEHARQQLWPKLEYIHTKIRFERRGLAEVFDFGKGEEWKNEA